MVTYKQIARVIRCLFFAAIVLTGFSCKKFLDKKPVLSLAVPEKLNDLQGILDDQDGNGSCAYLDLPADDYYVSTGSWNSSTQDQRVNYLWDPAARITNEDYCWTAPYAVIYQANFILEVLPTVDPTPSIGVSYNSIKGSALFFRGFQFYQLAQLFCKPYSTENAGAPGIVLRLNSDVNEHYSRATVQQTYDQVISDLKQASALLPATVSVTTRPSKAAALGALARAYLSMRDYTNAGLYADSALALNSTLLDYNFLTPAGNPTVPSLYLDNAEVIFESTFSTSLQSYPRAIVDSTLYDSYDGNDWRKSVFFGSYSGTTFYFKGSYFSTSVITSNFCGIATDELYLTRAECRARADDKTGALLDLNTLLRKRWKTGTFTDVTATDAADALRKILTERRKELLFRGIRWTDLRRFNLENANITLKRIINNTTYTLPPNDARWVLPIPDLEINRSGIAQNIR